MRRRVGIAVIAGLCAFIGCRKDVETPSVKFTQAPVVKDRALTARFEVVSRRDKACRVERYLQIKDYAYSSRLEKSVPDTNAATTVRCGAGSRVGHKGGGLTQLEKRIRIPDLSKFLKHNFKFFESYKDQTFHFRVRIIVQTNDNNDWFSWTNPDCEILYSNWLQYEHREPSERSSNKADADDGK